ncbi:MAG: cupin domain-containing protein [Cyanobacteria bacterium J06626_23]
MTSLLISPETPVIQLKDQITYPASGILSKVLWKNDQCQYSLFCLAADTEISEHTSPCNATIQVLEGTGSLTLEGENMPLSPGVFIFMAANAPHALAATSNLAFMLTLSAVG